MYNYYFFKFFLLCCNASVFVNKDMFYINSIKNYLLSYLLTGYLCRFQPIITAYNSAAVSTASVQPLQNVLNAAARIIGLLRERNPITSPLTFEIDYIGCPFSRELNTKCVNCAHRCRNQPIVVTSVQLLGVTLQFHAPEQRDTARDVLPFLVQHFGIHSHCLFVIHH